MKKLLIFHPTIAPYRIDFFNDLYKGFETDIYLYYSNLKSQKFDYKSIQEQFVFSPNYLKKGTTIGKKDFYKGYLKAILRHKPDIVLTSEFDSGNLWAIIAKLFVKNMRIVTICDDSVRWASECSIKRKLARAFLIKFIDGIILCNNAAEDWYRSKFDIDTVTFPIIRKDDDYRNILSQALILSNEIIREYNLSEKKVVLFVGRMVKEKNVEYLVESFIQYCKRNSDAVLFLIGDSGSLDGSVEKRIGKRISDVGLQSRIIMPGRKEGLELYAYYNVAQVFVLPSIFEPFGAVTNEALLAGNYVLISKNAGSACLVTDKNGEVIDIDKETIDFSCLERIKPLTSECTVKDNSMPYLYCDKMEELKKWIVDISTVRNN